MRITPRRHRFVSPVLALGLASIAGSVGHADEMAAAVAESARRSCAEIGVSADGSQVLDDHLAERVRVQAMADRLLTIQQETIADLEAEQNTRRSAEFKQRMDAAVGEQDAVLNDISKLEDQAVLAETRARDEAKSALAAARRQLTEREEAIQFQLPQAIERHNTSAAAAGSFIQSRRALRELLVERGELDRKYGGVLGWYLTGETSESAYENVDSQIGQHLANANRQVEIINGQLSPGEPQVPGISDNVDSLKQGLAETQAVVYQITAEMFKDRKRFEDMQADRADAERAVNEAERLLARAEQRLVTARRQFSPPAAVLGRLFDAVKAIDTLNEPYEVATGVARGVNDYVARVQSCIETARSSWRDAGIRGGVLTGRWSWSCDARDDRTGTFRKLNYRGTFKINVVAINTSADGNRRAEISALFQADGEPAARPVSGLLVPERWDDQGNPTMCGLEIEERGDADGHSALFQIGGTVHGNPFSDGPLTGDGALYRLDRLNGVTHLDCRGNWKTGG